MIEKLHAKLSLKGGFFSEELVEQEMSVLYIKPEDVVLELGGNIGRNSLIIASLLTDPAQQLVVIESDPVSCEILNENRDRNGFDFRTYPMALSKRPLLQWGWDTKPYDEQSLSDGWKPVVSISYEELREQTGLRFNTLVCDCEGALYYILMDEPDFLNGIEKILMENDFWGDDDKEQVVHNLFRQKGFHPVFSRDLGPPYGGFRANFWQVWLR